MYYKPDTLQVFLDHSAIRMGMPANILLPEVLSDDDLAFLGIHELHVDAKPFDCSKVFTAANPVLRDGAWWQAWDAREATAQEMASAQKAQIDALIKGAVDRLNTFAAQRIYGDEKTSPIVAACSFAASPHERFGPEGRYCVSVRDETWDVINQLQADVLGGQRAVPSSFEDFEPELPQLEWPVN